jgi:hypothetical protein
MVTSCSLCVEKVQTELSVIASGIGKAGWEHNIVERGLKVGRYLTDEKGFYGVVVNNKKSL